MLSQPLPPLALGKLALPLSEACAERAFSDPQGRTDPDGKGIGELAQAFIPV